MKFDFIYPDSNILERNRRKIQQPNHQKEEEINDFFIENEELVIDKLKNDPDLWEKLKQRLEN